MKIQKNDDEIYYILSEIDVKEAVVQYVENWENISIGDYRNFNFCGDLLELHTQNNPPEAKIKKTQKIKKKSKNKAKNNKKK